MPQLNSSSLDKPTTTPRAPGPLQIDASTYIRKFRETPRLSPHSQLSKEHKILHKNHQKALTERQSCLRCKALGFRCSFSVDLERSSDTKVSIYSSKYFASTIPLEKEKFKGVVEGGRPCCSRCFRDGEVFCVAPGKVRRGVVDVGDIKFVREEEGWVVEGASGVLVSEKIEEFLGPKREGRRFVPPVKEGEVERVKKGLLPIFGGEGAVFGLAYHPVYNRLTEREAKEKRKWREEVKLMESREEVEDKKQRERDEEEMRIWREQVRLMDEREEVEEEW